MKRLLISLLMVFAAVFSITTVMADEEPGVELSIGSVCVRSGETFLVPVYAEVNEGFASIGVDIQYDNTVLTPVRIRRSELFDGSFIPNLSFREDTIRVAMTSTQNNTQSGILFYVEFTAIAETDTASEVKATIDFLGNENFENVSHTEKNGKVNVSVNYWLPFEVEMSILPGVAETEAEAEVSNLSYENAEGILYLASYDAQGRMTAVHSSEVSAEPYEHNLKFTLDIPEAERFKAFVLTADMRPYSYFKTN